MGGQRVASRESPFPSGLCSPGTWQQGRAWVDRGPQWWGGREAPGRPFRARDAVDWTTASGRLDLRGEWSLSQETKQTCARGGGAAAFSKVPWRRAPVGRARLSRGRPPGRPHDRNQPQSQRPGRQRAGLSPSGMSEARVDAGLAHAFRWAAGTEAQPGFIQVAVSGAAVGAGPPGLHRGQTVQDAPSTRSGAHLVPWWTTAVLQPGGVGNQRQSYH